MARESRLLPMPTFSEFYAALNGRSPFPWQARLAEQVEESGRWPAEIGVPTGLGKTTCLDIAVWWLAGQAGWSPAVRTAPTRIWWLVNRRLLVDSTADHALGIRDALLDGASEPLLAVGNRLRSLAAVPADSPIDVVRLRGGVAARRPADPSRPAIILATIPMYGSRLLFRGYGTSRTMRPVDAALAGTDSLVLVDEAHLARHLTNLIPKLAECSRGAEEVLPRARSRPQVVALTATGDATGGSRFDLTDEDEVSETIRQRLDAKKPTQVRTHPRHAVRHLAEAAVGLLKKARPSSCLVFANAPNTARRVFSALQTRFPPSAAEMVLLTGRTREREAKAIRRKILDRVDGMAAGRDPVSVRSRHLIVVSTQTLEVGADIDAEYMVTETCGVRALTQRLGRLNRFGGFGHAQCVYVHMPPEGGGRQRGTTSIVWPVYGPEPETVVLRLRKAIDSAAGTIDLSPRVVSEVLGRPEDDPGRAPEIFSGLLWEWIKTTTPPQGEAPVEPYFSGISGADYSVSVVWRAHIPDSGRLWPRPSNGEVVQVPIEEVRRTLGEGGEVCRLTTDRTTVEVAQPEDLRPGDLIILPTDKGLLDDFGWNPDSTAVVFDMSVKARGLPLEEEAIRRLGIRLDTIPESDSVRTNLKRLLWKAVGHIYDDEIADAADRQEAADLFRQALGEIKPIGWGDAEWRTYLEALDRRVVSSPGEVSRFALAGVQGERPNDEFDERSLAPSAALLHRHGETVGTVSHLIARQIGIAPELVAIVHKAGRWHDCGKADLRFQRWLSGSSLAGDAHTPQLLAKSELPRRLWTVARTSAGWPRGGRHEALSARLVRQWIERAETNYGPGMADLLIHLVVSHHGSGRPLVVPVDDNGPDNVLHVIEGVRVEVPANLSVVDWTQPTRFRQLNDRFGPWGLALMEAIVRQADQSVSAGISVKSLEDRS